MTGSSGPGCRPAVLYLWDADYPWDVRVEKIGESLARNGHAVHIVARNLKRRPTFERVGDLNVHRLEPRGSDRMNHALSFPAFFSPIWARKIDDVIRSEGIGVIIVRDLPLAIAGIRAGRRHGIPVVFDMAEDYVSMVWNNWRHRKARLVNVLVRNPYLARLVERYAMPRVDHTLIVVEEAARVVDAAGGSTDRTTVVSNTPRLDEVDAVPVASSELADRMRSSFSIVYQGGIRFERGLRLMVDAVDALREEIPDVLFVAIGSGSNLEELRAETERRDLRDHVVWTGWMDHAEMLAHTRAAKVGVIPNFASGHTNTTIPNKIFDYMALGLPVIASDAAPMKRVIDETGCGLSFASGDAADLARAIQEVKRSGGAFGERGRRAVESTYNWATDEARLFAAISEVVGP